MNIHVDYNVLYTNHETTVLHIIDRRRTRFCRRFSTIGKIVDLYTLVFITILLCPTSNHVFPPSTPTEGPCRRHRLPLGNSCGAPALVSSGNSDVGTETSRSRERGSHQGLRKSVIKVVDKHRSSCFFYFHNIVSRSVIATVDWTTSEKFFTFIVISNPNFLRKKP